MLAAALLTFREGLEAALIVRVMPGYVGASVGNACNTSVGALQATRPSAREAANNQSLLPMSSPTSTGIA